MSEIIFKDESGNYPQSELFDQVAEFGGYCIGNFYDGGTGFIIKVLFDNTQISALLLTAAHVFVKDFVYNKNPNEFLIGDDTYLAHPLKDDLDWEDLSLRLEDPISNVKLSVPDDWVICELHKIPGNSYNSKLASIEIADPMIDRKHQNVELIGIPERIEESDLFQVCPESSYNRESLKEIQRCLNHEKKISKTIGTILHHDDLICTSCISANGMSGGPLLIREEGTLKVVGLLHGGPASQIHFFITEISSSTSRSAAMPRHLHEYYMHKMSNITSSVNIDFVKGCIGVLNVIEIFFSNQILSRGILKDLLRTLYKNALKVEYISGSFINYNLCISFRKIFANIQNILANYQ